MRTGVKLVGRLATYEFGESAEEGAAANAGAPSHPLDLRLARDAVAGDARARQEFAQRMQCVPRFLYVINKRLGRPFDDGELEDLTQETLVEIWRRVASYSGFAALETWAYRFCQQVLSSRLRTNQRRPANVELEESDHPEDVDGARFDYEPLYAALDRLDPEAAAIVRQRHFERLTFEEISVRRARPQSSIKVVYQRAIARLRDILEPLRKRAEL